MNRKPFKANDYNRIVGCAAALVLLVTSTIVAICATAIYLTAGNQ